MGDRSAAKRRISAVAKVVALSEPVQDHHPGPVSGRGSTEDGIDILSALPQDAAFAVARNCGTESLQPRFSCVIIAWAAVRVGKPPGPRQPRRNRKRGDARDRHRASATT